MIWVERAKDKMNCVKLAMVLEENKEFKRMKEPTHTLIESMDVPNLVTKIAMSGYSHCFVKFSLSSRA